MEGPSLKIAVEQLNSFNGKKVLSALGSTQTIDKDKLKGKRLSDIFSWGKHLVFQFDEVALRVHFLLWGSFRADIKGKSVTGEYYKKGVTKKPRLSLKFSNGNINFYNSSLKFIESKNAKTEYDFNVDILADKWDPKKALLKMKAYPNEEIADVLLDQTIFSGVGNIIKNEVLFRVKINPKTKVKDLEDKDLRNIIMEAEIYSWQFYEWRKNFELKKHFQVYRKTTCPNDGSKIVREKTGKRKRISFYCLIEQPPPRELPLSL